ncbi:MAG: VOC family protein [Myxococcales bacterium]|nr:VOC family protein [Myxococcales bacterium]
MSGTLPPRWAEIVRAYALGIDHVAIAVPDLDASLAFYRDVLAFEVLDTLETRGEATGMVSAVVRLGQTTIVLLQGTEPASQVSRFVDGCGAGVQHVAIAVRDLDRVVAALEAGGACFETPVIEGPHTRQRFTVRDAVIGVRIELIERTSAGFSEASVEALFRVLESRGAW